MALTIDLGVAELAATRFAISPLSETVSGLQQLGDVDRHPINLRWLRWAADELAGRPLDLSHTLPLLVNGRSSWPEFLVPAPLGAGPPSRRIWRRCEGRPPVRCGPASGACSAKNSPTPPPRSPRGRRQACGRSPRNSGRRADRLIAPHWSRIRAVLDADVIYRARQLAAGGADEVVHRPAPGSALARRAADAGGNALPDRARREPRSGWLVLIPVVLGSPYVLIKKSTSTQTTVRYPARGVGALWTAGTRAPAGGAVRLLGRVRAELLEALRSPRRRRTWLVRSASRPARCRSISACCARVGWSRAERSGRNVLYMTTALGASLSGPPA